MARTKRLTLSIIIPAYNEEGYLRRCLDSIAAQTVKPLDVIVIDNNSSDRTANVVNSYKFAKLLKEPRQGQVFAQAKGFDAARANILARLDADTILPPNWVERITAHFTRDPGVAAVTGQADPYDVSDKRIAAWVFSLYQWHFNKLFFGHHILWGSNCAFRADLWPGIKKEMTYKRNIWEDYDMSFCLAPYGTIMFDKTLTVGCAFRSAHKSLAEQGEYQFRPVRTARLHYGIVRTILYAVVRLSPILLYPLIVLDRWRIKDKKPV